MLQDPREHSAPTPQHQHSRTKPWSGLAQQESYGVSADRHKERMKCHFFFFFPLFPQKKKGNKNCGGQGGK